MYFIPFLFVVLTDYILREATGLGVTVGNKLLSDLDFSDDMAVLESVEQWFQELFDKVSDKAEHVGRKINIAETKSTATPVFPLELIRRNSRIEQIHELKYLSDWIKYKGELQNEIKTRLWIKEVLYYLKTATS